MKNEIYNLKEGTSDCCGAPVNRDRGICYDCHEHCEEVFCEMCEGVGEVEDQEYECNDSTGYNTVVMGTGKMIPCPECKSPDQGEEE